MKKEILTLLFICLLVLTLLSSSAWALPVGSYTLNVVNDFTVTNVAGDADRWNGIDDLWAINASEGWWGSSYPSIQCMYGENSGGGNAVTLSVAIDTGLTIENLSYQTVVMYASPDQWASSDIAVEGAGATDDYAAKYQANEDYYSFAWINVDGSWVSDGSLDITMGNYNASNSLGWANAGLFSFDVVHVVPEPATIGLLGLGALGLIRGRRRQGK